jgi:anti-sigma factor RsiW
MENNQITPIVHLDDDTLNEYMDNNLDPSSWKAVDTHLKECANCRRRAADIRLVFQALNSVQDIAISSDISANVMSQIQDEQPAGRIPLWLVALILFQVLIILIMAIVLWPSAGDWLIQAGQSLPETLNGLPVQNILNQPDDLFRTLISTLVEMSGSIESPLFLSAGQWALVITLALIIWLVGNSMLLRGERNRPE